MNRSRKTCAACVSAVVLMAACGGTTEQETAAAIAPAQAVLSVDEAWARPADSGATAAVYFTLVNTAPIADTLSGATSEAAEETGLHMSMQHEGTMHMAALTSLPVPAEDSVNFAPLGAHVMLTRMTRAFTVGDTIPVTLTFVSGQTIAVRAGVRAP